MTPVVLLPYQQEWLADTAKVRIAEKSRRIGLSWAAASEVTLEGASTNGHDTWYIGYNKEMSQEFIRDCADWAKNYSDSAIEIEESIFDDEDSSKNILTYAIRFASGYRITALSSRPTNLRNKKGHVIIDEAAFHDDLKGLMKSAMAVLMWGGDARVDIISTHNGVDNYFNELIADVRAKRRPYSLHRITLDDALAQGLYKRICLVNGEKWTPKLEETWRANLFAQYGDAAEEELNCEPANSGGSYITRDLIDRAMRPAPVVRLTCQDGFAQWTPEAREGHVTQWCAENILSLLEELPKGMMHFFGEDFGRTSDRTVIAPSFYTQTMTLKFPFMVELSNVPFEQQKQVLFYIVERLPNFCGGALDATGNGAYLAEVAAQKFGFDKIEQVSLSDKWYAENLPPFKAAFEDEEIEIAKDADHLNDISHIKTINGLPKLPKAKTNSNGEGPPRHGDAAIAYALAHYAAKTTGSRFGKFKLPDQADYDPEAEAGQYDSQ